MRKKSRNNGGDGVTLTFADIENIAGAPVDHSFLTYKKELLPYGYQVAKISLKAQTVAFTKRKDEEP